MKLLTIGTRVRKKRIGKQKADKTVFEIKDIGIFNRDGDSATVNCGGSIDYLVYREGTTDGGWVPYDSVYALPSAPDDIEESHTESDIATQAFDMVSWKAGLESRPDNDKLASVVTLLMALQYDKEGQYGSSWKGKGEYRGIMSNIDRKYDRLDKMTNDEIAGTRKSLAAQEELLNTNYELYSAEVGESKMDAVADLTNYGLLYMTWMMEKYPLAFNVWVDKNIPKYLADKIPFISK